MARRRRLSGAILTAGLVLATGGAQAAGVEPAHEIRLLGQRFTPPAGVPETARQAIGRRAEELRARGKERLHLLVQLHEVPSPAGRQELARQGLDLGAFVPGSAFIAAVPVGRAVAAVANPRVRWAALWEARHKLHPRVAAGDWAPWARDPARPEMIAVMLLLHHDVPLTDGPALAEKVGGVAIPAVEGLHGMTVWLPQTRVAELAAEEEVLWIEEAPPPLTPTNDGVRSGLRANGLAEAPYNLDGSGVRLFVFDGGSVRGTHETFDPGTGSRVTVIDGQPVSDHATHVAGTAAGDGSGSADGRGRGVAPGVSVLSAGYQQTAGSMLFWDNAGDIEADYANARTSHGADLGTSSIGSNTAGNDYPCEREGDYGVSSSLIDGIVHGTNSAVGSPMLITWSAGNERSSGNPPGLCGSNYGTTAPPACAKNPIHVGAVNSDGLSMTGFSSWGPCDDGSLKPTVVAPGCETGLVTGETGILSSTAASDSDYDGACGTSMATPAVAGVASLLTQAWREQGHGGPHDRPLPALVKALLIHTARDLGPEGPDYIYGYGAVDAKAAIDLLRGNDSFHGWKTGTVEQGEIIEHYFNGPWQDLDEAKVTLVWDDPAAAPFAAAALVNDLTLEYSTHLTYFTPYHPWILNPASPHLPATTGVDSLNNVEQIVVRDVPMTDTLMRVTGTRVPQGSQSYALVFSFNPVVVDKTACTVTSSTFETGTDGWTLTGAARETAPASGHGAASLRLGGSVGGDVDELHEATRQVVVPNETRAELAFWWYMTTEESLDQFGFGFDPFTAEIRDQAGTVLAVVDLRNDGWPQDRWMQQRIDLKPWAGQTVTVAFTATNDFLAATTFWVDDVTVTNCPQICNTGGSTAPVVVVSVDDPPVAVADAATVAEDSGATAVPVLANDTDPDGGPISITSVSQPANGTVVITGCGTGLIYAPDANYCNTQPGGTPDTFTYTLTPGGSVATVSVTVICVDDNPVAVANAATVAEDSGATAIDVLANDTDADGGTKLIQSVTQPAGGTVVITSGGTGLTYQPNPNFCTPGAPDTFTYTLTPGGSSTTVTMTVTCVDDLPVAVNDAATVAEDSGATAIPVLANDTDPDGGPISITSVTQPANGAVVITGGGTGLTYQPNGNYCNNPSGTPDTFIYTLTPGGSTATVSMTVTCVNDPPVLATNPITYTTPGNTQLHVADATLAGVASWSDAQSATAKSSPSDINGPGPLQVVAASGSSTNGGSFSIATNGSFTYVPPVGFTGTDSFTYTVTDNGAPAATVTGTINITVGQRVWYIRDVIDANNAAGGDGRSSNAFDSIAAFNAATTNDGDIIFIFEGNTGTTPLTGSISLRNGQKLWGHGIDLDVPGFGILVNDTNKPRIRTTTASTNVVSVPATAGNRNNVEIRGLDLEATGATSNAIDVTSSGANNVSVTINTNNVRGATAEGMDVNAGSTGTATIAIHDNTLTSNGTAIDITRTAGTVFITAFDDNVISGDSNGAGIVVTGPATFDATPGGALNPVSGGVTVIGASGNAITGAGLTLGNVAGALDFTDLDVFAGGAGVMITGTGSFSGAAGTRVTVPNGVSIIQAGNGPGVDVSNATIDLQLASLTVSASPTTGISLINVSDGTVAPASAFFSASSGSTIANVTGTDFNVDGGNATISYAGSISNTAGRSVSVQNRTADSVTFASTSTINDTGTGILVNANAAGAVTDFLGTLTLNTGANAAFAATSGGTLRVMGATNTITTTTGVALSMTNTTIGTGSGAPETGLRFRRISAGTAASGPTNGIVLNNTGALGGLTITGAGTPDSGGTIQNTSGSAILATNTQDLSLTGIRISAPGNHGIEATNLRGTCLLASSTITGFNFSTGNGYRLVNNNTNLTKLTISASTFSSSATGNDGVFLEARGTSNMTVSVESSCTFTGLFGDGIDAQTITGASGNVNLTVKSSTFTNAAPNGNNGISIDPFGGPVNFTFDIDANVFDTIMHPVTNLGAINITAGDLDGSGPTVTGTIQNNTLNNIVGARGISMIADTFAGQLDLTINNNHIDRLGSTSKYGIFVDARNNVPNADVTVTNNQIGQAANLWASGAGTGNGILLQTQNSATMDALLSGNQVDANTSSAIEAVRVRAIHSSTLNVTVTGNDLQDTSTPHVELAALTGTAGSAGGTICLNISGNTVPAAGVGVIRITENTAPGTINVTQASAAAVATANSNATVTVTGTPTFGVPACPLP